MMLPRRRSDNVFLLTLVDFLIQIIFFGLFVFAVWQAVLNRGAEKRYDPQDVKDAVEAAGVSNLKELVDELSKLAPVRLKGMNDTLGKDLTPEQVAKVREAIAQAGGADGLSNAMQRLARLEQGSDKPPCIFEMVNGQRKAKTLATAVESASSITFSGTTPELEQLLADLGLSYPAVQSLSVREFPRSSAECSRRIRIAAIPSCSVRRPQWSTRAMQRVRSSISSSVSRSASPDTARYGVVGRVGRVESYVGGSSAAVRPPIAIPAQGRATANHRAVQVCSVRKLAPGGRSRSARITF